MSSENVQVKDGVVEADDPLKPKKAKNSPKTSQATWTALKLEFEAGSYLSLQELSDKHGVNPITLRTRMFREKWNEKQRTLQNKVELRVESNALKLVDQQTKYLSESFLRAKKYEALIDNSIAQVGGIVEPSDLDAYTRSELRIHELAKSSLRVVPVSQVDHAHTVSLGDSFISAIQKLRESNLPKLNSTDLKNVLEAEIVD